MFDDARWATTRAIATTSDGTVMMIGKGRHIGGISAIASVTAMTTRGDSDEVPARVTATHMISWSREAAPTNEGRSAIVMCGTAATIRATYSRDFSTCPEVATGNSFTTRVAGSTRCAGRKAVRCRPPAPSVSCPRANSETVQAAQATHATASSGIFANRG